MKWRITRGLGVSLKIPLLKPQCVCVCVLRTIHSVQPRTESTFVSQCDGWLADAKEMSPNRLCQFSYTNTCVLLCVIADNHHWSHRRNSISFKAENVLGLFGSCEKRRCNFAAALTVTRMWDRDVLHWGQSKDFLGLSGHMSCVVLWISRKRPGQRLTDCGQSLALCRSYDKTIFFARPS